MASLLEMLQSSSCRGITRTIEAYWKSGDYEMSYKFIPLPLCIDETADDTVKHVLQYSQPLQKRNLDELLTFNTTAEKTVRILAGLCIKNDNQST